jgi:hypothetical protein
VSAPGVETRSSALAVYRDGMDNVATKATPRMSKNVKRISRRRREMIAK